MKTRAWKDLKHGISPEQMAQLKREALEEYDRMGFAALRKAREQTQVALAEKLGINQASVSAIEHNTDLLLSTLAKYVRALGGEVEIRAVFPEATFNLEPILGGEAAAHPAQSIAGKSVAAEHKATLPRRPKAAASRA